MRITANFDSGVMAPHSVERDVVSFDLSPGQKILHVLIDQAPPRVRVRLKLEGKGMPFIAGQGSVSRRALPRPAFRPRCARTHRLHPPPARLKTKRRRG
jgi:hypothetical protein